MKRWPLRALLLVSVLGTITVAFTAFAFYIDRVETANRLGDIDDELFRASANSARYRSDQRLPPNGRGRSADGPDPVAETDQSEQNDGGDTALADPPVQLVLSPDGKILAFANPVPFDQDTLASLANTSQTSTIDSPNYRVLTSVEGEGNTSVTAISLTEFDRAVQRFRAALTGGGVVLLSVVAAMVWLVSGWLTKPVAEMAETANRIAAGQLDTPVGQPGGSKETAELALDLKRMLDRLRQALADANESRDAMQRLVADLAHEIRTPLTALKGYSDLYTNGMLASSDDVDRAMDRIGSESARLTVLANTMLELAIKADADRAIEPVDLAAVTAAVVSDLQAAYPSHTINLTVHSADQGSMVDADQADLHRVILNLGSNACNHSPSSEPIGFEVSDQEDNVTVTVVDRGPGIPPEVRQQVFEPFYRADTVRNRSGQHGAGLGLAVVNQIAKRYRADVELSETVGGGTTATFTMPAGSICPE